MTKLSDIVSYLDSELRVPEFNDESLNGLQVEGNPSVGSVSVAVDAGIAVIEAAIAKHAQLLIVHHGLFWGQPSALRGPLGQAVRMLIEANLSLYAVHLPLDAHSRWGNNATLARRLGLGNLEACTPYRGQMIGVVGSNLANSSREDIVANLKTLPGAAPEFCCLNFGPSIPTRIAIVSGSGADAIREHKLAGFDTLITGEPKQFLYHYARERALNVICAGHYATETVGVIELGKALHEHFSLPYEFIDFPTGI